MTEKNNDAAVFILLGQSNATGHALPMLQDDMILTPLKNVYGLSRNDNQSFEIEELRWSNYTSYGMNLAEEQDNTYSIANCLAAKWQKTIDEGKVLLPDLHIVHISIGAQGVTKGFMWNPEYEKKLVPGKLFTVDISLYLFTLHILSLLKNSFEKIGKNMKIIGLHWRGGEEEIGVKNGVLPDELKNIYDILLNGFRNAIGDHFPIVIHKLVCDGRAAQGDTEGVRMKNYHVINSVFERLKDENKNISLFYPENAPNYNPDTYDHGVFAEDFVHYTKEFNEWAANKILLNFIDEIKQ